MTKNNKILQGFLLLSICLVFLFGCIDHAAVEPLPLSTPAVTLNGDTVSWATVEHAERYEISIDGVLQYVESSVTAKTLSYGEKFKIRAIGNGSSYTDSAWSNSFLCIKKTKTDPLPLSTPVVTLNGDTVSWATVEHAERYEISIDGVLQYVESSVTAKTLSYGEKFKIRAIGDGSIYTDSAWSHNVIVDQRPDTALPVISDSMSTVKSVAHRGYSAEAPENTLSAYRLAKQKGFYYVECDISFTKDGYAVLLHDATVDRTSNGTGSIANMTLEEARALDFGSWKSEKYKGEKIPTFEEFILLCKHLNLHPYIELKSGKATQVEELISIVKRYGMMEHVTWISFIHSCLSSVKTAAPKARLGYCVNRVTEDTVRVVNEWKSEGNEVFINCNAYSAAEAVPLCMNADIPLEVWTINNGTACLALDPYITGVTSDGLHAQQTFYENSIGKK